MTAAIEAVLFDCDGVLVDSERINNKILAALVTVAPNSAATSSA